MSGVMSNTDLSAADIKAAQKARKARLAAYLKAWGAPASGLTRLGAAFGAAQYAVFIGFAWGAAWAVSAAVIPPPPEPTTSTSVTRSKGGSVAVVMVSSPPF